MLGRKTSARFLCILIILLLSGLAFGYDFYGTNFQYRKDITIDSSLIDAPLSYFPVLVKLTSLNIDFTHFLHSTNDGYDIRFTDSIDGSGNADGNILDYERERFDKGSQVAEIWVEIPSIPNSPDTTFYMFYGNTDCADGEDVEHAWDGGTDASPADNYVGVWHLSETPTVDSYAYDSTDNSNDGTFNNLESSDQIPGQIDGCIDPDPFSSENIQISDSSTLDFSSSLTVSLWFRADSLPASGSFRSFLGKTGNIDLETFGTQGNYIMVLQNGLTVPGQAISFGFEDSAHNDYGADYEVTFSTSLWYHAVGVFDDNNNVLRLYINSIEEATTTNVTATPATNNRDLYFAISNAGEQSAVEDYYNGKLDEARISNIPRSAAWIKASFHSGNDSLLTIPTLVELSYFRATSLDSAVILEWATETELDNAGFNLWKSEEKDEEYARINSYFIPAEGEAGFGAEYSYTDYDVQNGNIYFYKLEDIDIYGKSTFRGPVPAFPHDIILIWPPDGEILPPGVLLFSWSSSGSFYFKVEISMNPSFPGSETLSFPEDKWTKGHSLWLTPREWEIVLSKAQQSGGQMFWRVRAMRQDGRLVYSDWKRFIVEKERLPDE